MQSSDIEKLATANAELKEVEGELTALDTYLEEHQSNQLLMKSFSMIRRDFDQMKQLTNMLGQIMDYLNKAEAQEASAQHDLDELNLVAADIIGRKEAAEKALAEATSANGDTSDAQSNLDAVLEESENLTIAVKEATETLTKASAEVQQFSGQRDQTTGNFNRIVEECHKRLAPFGIDGVSLETVDDIQLRLTKQLKSWQDKNSEKQKLLRRKQALESEIQGLSTSGN